ncbi:iron-containing alcohol dehydrogenase [Alicyclobacillus sp. SO9]|uniref:iron-containing alcohol dehydrogenase n=1 Tax=Alicyclobacillus sp. SO9 TaxID=2665646 RepID=UPI0018E7584F|nr:iron-containing alcohol dehydrogenase [Alicyclobacillus sp. SO9]QQE81056.1 iron-containing alcohol dehydrogenase [Alicyclobacillus sp. SO9]
MPMFTYSVPTSIVFGTGEASHLARHIQVTTPASRWLVVSDPGIVKAGLLHPLLTSLQQAGFQTELFTQVLPNPRDTDCITGAERYVEFDAEGVIGIGGGSAMDTAKTVALLSQSRGTPREFADGEVPYIEPAPIVCVPTTAGTGSEVTRSAVITEASTHRKLTLKHSWLRPKLAVLDALLTRTVPKPVTAATGVDALVHAIEGYTCTQRSPITQAFGARAMRQLVPALPLVVENGDDLEARTQMLEGSLLAGLCFGSSDVAAVHCLAEALGGLYDTPHGVANAIFLPEVLRFNAEADTPLHGEIARLMGFANDADNDAEAVQKMLTGIHHLTRSLGIPTLRSLGYVKQDDFEKLVELAVKNTSTVSNVRPINAAEYRGILERVYAEKG